MNRPLLPAAPGYLWAPVLAGLVAINIGLVAINFWTGDDGPSDTSSQPLLAPDGTLRQPVHWHADFAVVVNGEQFDFNRPGFISKEGEEKNPWVHIHEPRPTVVHVHREQTTWDEFLGSLGFRLTDTKLTLPDGRVFTTGEGGTLKFFVNGVKVDILAFEYISDLSQVLISFGPETEEQVRASQVPLVTDQACIPSELCLDRMPAEPEKEPCSRSGDSCTG